MQQWESPYLSAHMDFSPLGTGTGIDGDKA